MEPFDYSNIDFVIVGPSKTGTVWLAQCLREHSGIFVSGENNFLTHYSDMGWDHWKKNFDRRGKKKIIGDYANNYCFFDGVPEQLAKLNPSVKIIFCIRDPLKRTVSFYKHDIRWNTVGKHMRLKFLVKEDLFFNRYIYAGRYSLHINRFLECFPAEQFYLFTSPGEGEQLDRRLADVFRFLGVKEETVPSFQKRLNVTPTPMFPALHRASFYSKNKKIKWLSRKLDPMNIKMGRKRAHLQISEEDTRHVRDLFIKYKEAENLQTVAARNQLQGNLYIDDWGLKE
ncbi:MAG: sulfotransferase domain-containing protein [bacterium]|nr:sulfotransferase domain-containing protein [bacterium]